MSRLIALVFAFLLVPVVAFAQTEPEQAAEFIENLGQRAVDVLRDQSITLEERESKLRGIVHESFDVEVIGRFVLADFWKTADADERDEFLVLFSDYVLQTYSQRLGGYSGQTLRIDDSRSHRDKDAVVETTIIQDGTDPTGVSWLVRDTDKGLRILDVIVEGKSLALAQKKEFSSILAREKMPGLLQLLRLKTSKYSVQS
ncbi:ABC transporter substrate-binding protein [Rhodospirillaceae bacterium KN72]|uniref:ABC transporter substrate-binding protein n=1 Tax=Pacificispira spongiicola TaxID=2729598 RepID=A0A7Y0HFM0_9PROT|nr:ABC transporter substrate-binding protein [Pacificispira spongiicola]NMM46011.1 ABC transporter substrate-binding protein [Pacificispira spongiicola]